MSCLPNVNFFSERNFDDNADLAVFITEHSHSEQRKYCVRKSTSLLILSLNGFTFRLKQKSHRRRMWSEYCLDVSELHDS